MAWLLAEVCTAQQMLDLRQFLRTMTWWPTLDVCANLAASIARVHLCPSIATVAIIPLAQS